VNTWPLLEKKSTNASFFALFTSLNTFFSFYFNAVDPNGDDLSIPDPRKHPYNQMDASSTPANSALQTIIGVGA